MDIKTFTKNKEQILNLTQNIYQSFVQMRTRDFLGVSIICLNTDKISSAPPSENI